MRIDINFDFAGNLNIPFQHQEQIQGLVYNLLSEFQDVGWLHNEGAKYGKRQFKPLVFSQLIGFRRALKNNFSYQSPLKLCVASPDTKLIHSIAKYLKRRGYFRLVGKTLALLNYDIVENEDVKNLNIRTLSPIIAYSTLTNPIGKKFTLYHSPHHPEFSRVVKENLQKKAEVFYNLKLDENFMILPDFDISKKEDKFYYKNILYKGWSGKFKIVGSHEYIYVAQNCGMGSKNAQGFGMIETI